MVEIITDESSDSFSDCVLIYHLKWNLGGFLSDEQLSESGHVQWRHNDVINPGFSESIFVSNLSSLKKIHVSSPMFRRFKIFLATTRFDFYKLILERFVSNVRMVVMDSAFQQCNLIPNQQLFIFLKLTAVHRVKGLVSKRVTDWSK